MMDELRPLPAPYGLRRSNDRDTDFRFRLFCDARPDLNRLEVPAEQKETLLRLQFGAQQRGYQTHYPDAIGWVIEYLDRPVGLVTLDQQHRIVHLIELVLLENHRNRRIGSTLLTALQSHAQARGLLIRLSVARENHGAARLYFRLGFRTLEETAGDWRLEWRPPATDDASNSPRPPQTIGMGL